MGRRLNPEEQALWARVAAGVKPLFGRSAPDAPPPSLEGRGRGWVEEARPPSPTIHPNPASGEQRPALFRSCRGHDRPDALAGRGSAANTLDASWDRRLARGLVPPDLTLDLHGHTLAAAHAALDQGLARAVASHARLVLLVTGRPPTTEWTGGPRRGAIRAAVGDWLAASRYTDRIAAVRAAHPRHGGAGALYVVLRRAR